MNMMDAEITDGSLQVLGSTTQVTIERSDGLRPMLEYTFEIRAESQEGRLGEKREVSAYLGMSLYCNIVNLLPHEQYKEYPYLQDGITP